MDKKEEKRFEESRLIDEQNKSRGKENFPKTKRLRTPEGTIVYYWDNKLHNWEGPALIPEGNNRLREYYIYGIKYTEEDWKEAKRSGKGLPWFKDPKHTSRSAG
jgi:hypothetical protein|tara:strand:+ start:413 stop:724 length:312 start_codon:yes stop_codon:yes gene_type:complete